MTYTMRYAAARKCRKPKTARRIGLDLDGVPEAQRIYRGPIWSLFRGFRHMRARER
jgi:hypothetical protein